MTNLSDFLGSCDHLLVEIWINIFEWTINAQNIEFEFGVYFCKTLILHENVFHDVLWYAGNPWDQTKSEFQPLLNLHKWTDVLLRDESVLVFSSTCYYIRYITTYNDKFSKSQRACICIFRQWLQYKRVDHSFADMKYLTIFE